MELKDIKDSAHFSCFVSTKAADIAQYKRADLITALIDDDTLDAGLGESVLHESIVDQSYSLVEAAVILANTNYSFDSGLTEGLEPGEALVSGAAYFLSYEVRHALEKLFTKAKKNFESTRDGDSELKALCTTLKTAEGDEYEEAEEAKEALLNSLAGGALDQGIAAFDYDASFLSDVARNAIIDALVTHEMKNQILSAGSVQAALERAIRNGISSEPYQNLGDRELADLFKNRFGESEFEAACQLWQGRYETSLSSDEHQGDPASGPTLKF